MGNSKRFYETWPGDLPSPVADLISQIGNGLNLAGVVFQSNEQTVAILLPDAEVQPVDLSYQLAQSEWVTLLTQSDDPILFETDETGMRKPFARKIQYQISGAVQQQIWARDEFKCRYCQAEMGRAVLTVDHFMPLNLGGATTPDNLITACRKCNKRKSDMHPEEWCKKIGRSMTGVNLYIAAANKRVQW